MSENPKFKIFNTSGEQIIMVENFYPCKDGHFDLAISANDLIELIRKDYEKKKVSE